MNIIKQFSTLVFIGVLFFVSTSVYAVTSKIGILVFDGFLTSDVTAPIEVFGAATKKAWFSSYEVVVISTSKNKEVVSEEGLKIIADKTIYDALKLDVLIVPSAYEMDSFLKNKELIQYIKKQSESRLGWQVIVLELFCLVKQVFLMERKQQHGLAEKKG